MVSGIKSPSGRFLLRVDPRLHAALQRTAREAGVSLNEHCRRSLSASGCGRSVVSPASDVVGRAAAHLGAHLVGVVVYGSYARGEAEASSDIDVLIVADRSLRLTRGLYRRWDEEPVRWEGRPIDPHFAHLPETSDRPSGLWAELAIDGAVVFERGLAVSRALARIRRDILARKMLRRVVHGQPYWTAAS